MHVPRKDGESGRENTDDGLLFASDGHRLPENIWVGREHPLPQTLADNRPLTQAVLVLRQEEAPTKGFDSEQGKEIHAANACIDALGATDAGESGRVAAKSC